MLSKIHVSIVFMNSFEFHPGDVQSYVHTVADTQFALSCFGSLIPQLPECVVGVIDSIRDCTSVYFEGSKHPAPTSLVSSCNVEFNTKTIHYPGLDLLVEGVTRGLKGSGAEHRLMHLQRMLAGFIIGSEIAENVDRTFWYFGRRMVYPSLPELTQIFDLLTSSSNTPITDSKLIEVLEDQSIASHYRFAATSGLMVLSNSLSSMGALQSDTFAVYNRVRRRLNCASDLGSIIVDEALRDNPYSHDVEQGLSVLALGNTFSLAAYLNALTHFTPINNQI